MNKELIGIVDTDNYTLYHSPHIAKYHKEIIGDCEIAHDHFNKIFNSSSKGSTWEYEMYNIFSLTAGSLTFYIMYQQVIAAIREFVGDDRPLWMQCWMNYHQQGEVLKWHQHKVDLTAHGYVSIDPKNTVTEFINYSVENKVGNIYIGKTGKAYIHQVVVKEPYEGYRITLGFDVVETKKSAINLSFIPVP